jgi:hypothetical protein
VELIRIDWPTPDEPRQARRCTTGACDYTPRVEGECWLCPVCADRLRQERDALREALAGAQRRGAGYVVLCPDTGNAPTRLNVEAVLDALGLDRWDGDGFPAVVIFGHWSDKGSWFEAGYWGGSGVPLVYLGGGHGRSARRGHLVQRFRGWSVADGLAGLPDVLARLGLVNGPVKEA